MTATLFDSFRFKRAQQKQLEDQRQENFELLSTLSSKITQMESEVEALEVDCAYTDDLFNQAMGIEPKTTTTLWEVSCH